MENSELTEAELIAELQRKQQQVAAESAEQVDDLAHRRRMDELSRSMPQLTPEQLQRREAEIAERERDREKYARADRWLAFVRERGERYRDCRLQNFERTTEKQAAAVHLLTGYCESIGDRIADGEGIVLYGPKGTGKDHLLVAVCRAAFAAGKHLVWQNGMDLFGDIRDRMDSGDSERALVNRLVAPDVLYLSDPVPPLGNLSDFQSSMIFRILDGRYSRRKPTWCSVNVSKGSELETRMGAQNVDRLRDGALAIHCDWPSYREART